VRAGLVVVAAGLVLVAGSERDGRFVAIAAVAALGAWWWRPERDADRWRRAASGEMATAALLRRLPRRWVVLHDRAVPGSRANIDHLVIGRSGLWVVDTKTARARLQVRRGAVWAGERRIDTGPAAWEAEVVSEWLGAEVAPIVAVHGDGLRRRGKVSGGVRIVPAARVVRHLRRPRWRRVVSRADIAALAERAGDIFPPR